MAVGECIQGPRRGCSRSGGTPRAWPSVASTLCRADARAAAREATPDRQQQRHCNRMSRFLRTTSRRAAVATPQVAEAVLKGGGHHWRRRRRHRHRRTRAAVVVLALTRTRRHSHRRTRAAVVFRGTGPASVASLPPRCAQWQPCSRHHLGTDLSGLRWASMACGLDCAPSRRSSPRVRLVQPPPRRRGHRHLQARMKCSYSSRSRAAAAVQFEGGPLRGRCRRACAPLCAECCWLTFPRRAAGM